jgi:flagellar hook-basal body protein
MATACLTGRKNHEWWYLCSGFRRSPAADAVGSAHQQPANVNSPGYKADKPIFRLPTNGTDAIKSEDQSPALRQPLSPYTPPFDSIIDVSAGPLKKTGNPLDVAIEGPAFFAVETPNGEEYTRKGSFIVDADGNLTTSDGFAVLVSDPGLPFCVLEKGMFA